MDGEFHQARHVVDVELAHQARAIRVDRLGTQFEARGDFLGAHAFDQERKHLVLPRAEGIDRVFRLRS